MITATSRYSDSPVVTLQYENHDIAVIVPGQQEAFSFNFIWYQVTSLDRLDTLAYRFFLDASLWWRIADANPGVMDWSRLPTGTVIRIPVLQ